MLKKYIVAWIAVVAFVVVGLVSFAEAPDPFNVYMSLYTMTDNCMFVAVDEDVAHIAKGGVPVVSIYLSKGKGWICRYNLGEYSCVCYQGTTMTELEVLEYLMAAVADAGDVSVLDEYAVFVTYGDGTINSYIKPLGGVIAEFMKREGVI